MDLLAFGCEEETAGTAAELLLCTGEHKLRFGCLAAPSRGTDTVLGPWTGEMRGLGRKKRSCRTHEEVMEVPCSKFPPALWVRSWKGSKIQCFLLVMDHRCCKSVGPRWFIQGPQVNGVKSQQLLAKGAALTPWGTTSGQRELPGTPGVVLQKPSKPEQGYEAGVVKLSLKYSDGSNLWGQITVAYERTDVQQGNLPGAAGGLGG